MKAGKIIDIEDIKVIRAILESHFAILFDIDIGEEKFEFSDPLKVFMITKNREKSNEDRLIDLREWHVQIYKNREALYYARISYDEEQWQLNSVFQSPIPSKIDRGIQRLSESKEVNMQNTFVFEVPAFNMIAVLVGDGIKQTIIPIHGPEMLEIDQEYPLEDFMHAINEHEDTNGLIFAK